MALRRSSTLSVVGRRNKQQILKEFARPAPADTVSAPEITVTGGTAGDCIDVTGGAIDEGMAEILGESVELTGSNNCNGCSGTPPPIGATVITGEWASEIYSGSPIARLVYCELCAVGAVLVRGTHSVVSTPTAGRGSEVWPTTAQPYYHNVAYDPAPPDDPRHSINEVVNRTVQTHAGISGRAGLQRIAVTGSWLESYGDTMQVDIYKNATVPALTDPADPPWPGGHPPGWSDGDYVGTVTLTSDEIYDPGGTTTYNLHVCNTPQYLYSTGFTNDVIRIQNNEDIDGGVVASVNIAVGGNYTYESGQRIEVTLEHLSGFIWAPPVPVDYLEIYVDGLRLNSTQYEIDGDGNVIISAMDDPVVEVRIVGRVQ